MNLKQLAYFIRAVEVGNITHAAESLHIAQTALGIQVRNLERELGVALLDRHSRGVQPTPAGEVLLKHARDIIARVESARHEVRSAGKADLVQVNLGITSSIMKLVGDRIEADAVLKVPGVAIRMVENFSFMLQHQLETGELDWALTYNCPDIEGLVRTPVLEEDLLFCTSPDQAVDGPAIRFSDLVRTDLALASRQDVIYHLVHDEAARLGLPVNVMYEVQSVRAIKNLIVKGVATSVLPAGGAVEEIRDGVISARRIERPPLTRTLFIVRRLNGPPGLDVAAFDGFMRQIVDRLQAEVGDQTRLL